MKKILSLLVITLILALAFTSCTALKRAFVECEVKFDLDGGVAGEGFFESSTVKYGKTVAMSTPTRENFTFEGWYDGDTLYTAETPITKSVTLRAKWTFNNTYTLTFETNGMADVPVAHPVIGELPTIPAAPQVEGYVFAGWYFDAEYTTRYFFDYPLTEATTLYAKFYDTTLGEYTVISNVEQLMAIKDDPTAKYLLACDINCKGETLAPIDEFSGEIEGNGYKIHNFSINETADTVGFIRTNKGAVRNLSFEDFIFCIVTVSNSNSPHKQYGVVCGVNDGIIDNCDVLDSNLQITVSLVSTSTNWYYHNVGGIAGQNNGSIINSSSAATINVHSQNKAVTLYDLPQLVSYVGGVTGQNTKESTISNSFNYGDINLIMEVITNGKKSCAESFSYVGGIVGTNGGQVDKSANSANIKVDAEQQNYVKIMVYIGNACSNNAGRINDCYSTGNISVGKNITGLYVGGFLATNQGTIYNCYTVGDINISGNVSTSGTYKYNIAGFVGENKLISGYPATINKCFAMGNITLSNTPTNSGYFAGTNSGTIKDSYYANTLAINKVVVTENENGESVETLEAVEVTNTDGTAKAESELLSLDFLENTLYFDRMVWFLVDGKLPELR